MVLELHQHLLAEVPGLEKTPCTAGWSRLGHAQIPLKDGGVSFGIRDFCSYLQNVPKKNWVGGFKHFSFFTPTWGDDEHIFQMG